MPLKTDASNCMNVFRWMPFARPAWLMPLLLAGALLLPACGGNDGGGDPDPPIFTVKLGGDTWSTTDVVATQFLTNPDSTLNTEIVATDTTTGNQVRLLLAGNFQVRVFSYGGSSLQNSIAFVSDSVTYEPDIRFNNPEDSDQGSISIQSISSETVSGTFQGTLSRVGSNGMEKIELTDGSFQRVPLIF